MSAAEPQERTPLELTDEQRARYRDATARALRALAAELTIEGHDVGITNCLTEARDQAPTPGLVRFQSALDRAGVVLRAQALLQEVSYALSLYVVLAEAPRLSFQQGAAETWDDEWRAPILALSDRLDALIVAAREEARAS